MLRASSLLILLASLALRTCRSTKLVAKRLQVHRVRLHDSLAMPCAAKRGVPVTQVRWTQHGGGTAWKRQALWSVSRGNLRFPKVTAVVSGYYECTGYARMPRREVLIRVRHEIQDVCRPGSFSPGGHFRNCLPCDFSTYTELHASAFCLWCPPGKSTFRQGSTSPNDCEAATTEPRQKPTPVKEEKQPLLAATAVESRQAIGTQTDDQCHVNTVHCATQTETPEPAVKAVSSAYHETKDFAEASKVSAPTEPMPMIKELQDKTKKIAERLNKRKNTPQPRHHGELSL
ncbi:hypothetical protein MRX96_039598 [Rhipicephalus microplus]